MALHLKSPAQVQETIAAVATPPGRGGIGIIRVSGPRVTTIANAMLSPLPAPRKAEYRVFRDANGEAIDAGVVIFFPAPNSFTGEDVLELHGHGGPVVMDMLLGRVLKLGARPARPGEFSYRAFLNEKMDLVQAEAIAGLIDSASEAAARSAQRSLQGEFSRRVYTLVGPMVELRTYVEAAIDFPEEEIDFLSDDHVAGRLEKLLDELQQTLHAAHQGSLLREGITVVIAGRPNVGKSTLLNRLAGQESAIVTDIPGTTRDPLGVHVEIDGLPLHVVDTAGLRTTLDTVEKHGIRRAWDTIQAADAVLLVVDDQAGMTTEDAKILADLPANLTVVLVRNKIDLSAVPPTREVGERGTELRLSAKTGQGVDLLTQCLKQLVGYQNTSEGAFMARRRHLDALEKAKIALESARAQLVTYRAGELLAEDLRQAQYALGEITGEFTSEDLLDRIFCSFCIGK